MTLNWRALFALTVGYALTASTTVAQSTSGAELALFDGDATTVETAELVDEATGDIQLTQYSSLSGGVALGSSACTKQCFFGGEYLQVRANYSQAISYLTTDSSGVAPTLTYNQFEYDYGSSYRLYGGYRLCDCGCEVRFTYTNINSDSSFSSPAQTADITFTGPFEVITFGDGDSIRGSASLSMDNFDLGFSKTIPLGSPLCCDTGCGADCGCGDCNGCCGCWCPAWDITWTGAIRVANIDARQNFASNIVSTAVANRTATSTMSFDGIGLRTGVLGRRYFGKTGLASVYMKGDISLMVGDADYTAVGTEFARHSIGCTHVIPVTEIEAGGTLFLTRNASITGGYMLAAWHDLGWKAEYDFGATGTQLESWDDANILGLDGWFLRGEVAF